MSRCCTRTALRVSSLWRFGVLLAIAAALTLAAEPTTAAAPASPPPPSVDWSDPTLKNNPAFRELRERVQSGQASEEEQRYYFSFLYRAAPYEAIPKGAYERAMWEQAQLAGSAVAPAAVYSWLPMGPSNIEGRVTAIAPNPSNSTVFAGGELGGVWKSTNGGSSWIESTYDEAIPDFHVADIQWLPGSTSTVFVGAGNGYVYRTTDSGSNWAVLAQLPGQSTSRLVDRIRINPANTSVMWAVQQDYWGGLGVYKSTNSGGSWNLSKSSPGSYNDLALDVTNPSTLYAVLGQNGVYKTTNSGSSWTKLNVTGSGLPTTIVTGAITIAPTSSSTLYLTAQGSTGTDGLYRSTNSGVTWTLRSSINPGHCCFGEIEVDPTNSNNLYFSNFGALYKSTNGGSTLVDISGLEHHVDQQALKIQPNNPSIVWVGNDGGLEKSTDGAQSFVELPGLFVTEFYDIAGRPNSAVPVIGGTQDNWLVRYTGQAQWVWDQLINACGYGDVTSVVIDPNNPQVMYAQAPSPGSTKTNRSTDGGNTWTCQSTGLNATNPVWKVPLAIYKNSSGVLFTGGDAVYRSSLSGGNLAWTQISPARGSGNGLSAVAPGNASSNVVYAGTQSGRIWVTTNGGSTWTERTPATWGGRYITGIRVDPFSDSTAYVTLSGFGVSHVWKTTNSGVTWTSIGAGLPDAPYNDIAVSPTNSNHIIVVNDIAGVWKTTDGGANWYLLGNKTIRGWPSSTLLPLTSVVWEAGRNVMVSTYGLGTFEYPFSAP